jgi:DNA replication initiation complex subunit (GINS family)
MASESFSFESLSKQEALERKSPRLTRVEPTFWDQLWEYLDELETQALKAHAENPAARRSILLSDELRNAMRKAEAVWEARQRKITFFAM